MGLGRKQSESQGELWIARGCVARSPGHVFYDTLNRLLGDAGFDRFVEDLCAPYYASRGRPSIPPGRYFRMLLVGFFEDIGSQRGIAWRCADSLSLRSFLFLKADEAAPDHSSLTRIRDRLPLDVYEAVFQFVLRVVAEHGLLKGRTVGVDATTLEANAAMKSIVRKDSGDDWNAWLRELAAAEGVEIEDDEDLRRFDRKRSREGKKKVSNNDWESPSDPDSRIIRMKDGRTRLGYKQEQVVDLETEAVLSVRVHPGTDADTQTMCDSVLTAQGHLQAAGLDAEIEEVAADKGYHSAKNLASARAWGLRTYIPEPERGRRRWTGRPDEQQHAVVLNRQRMSRAKGKRLQKKRSERVERSFAHECDTGGGRRLWVRGLEKINKTRLITSAAHNLSLVLRKLLGTGKPRAFAAAFGAFCTLLEALCDLLTTRWRCLASHLNDWSLKGTHRNPAGPKDHHLSSYAVPA